MSSDVKAPYREITLAATVFGIALGIILTAALTYAGLVIGFVIPSSAIVAILGYGFLRGVLRKGTIVENNISQTIASGINNAAAGVIFTFPALLLMDDDSWSLWSILAASVAGAFLGTLFIIPLRKQMIDLERLKFPWGIAVAEILKSPGAGPRKSAILGISAVLALAFGLLVSFGQLPRIVDLGALIGLPSFVPFAFALSLLSIGAGFITGKPGLVVLIGGILAGWFIGPLLVALDWIPSASENAQNEAFIAETLEQQVNRPLGIGFLLGGALGGVILALPMLKAAYQSVRKVRLGSREELSFKAVGVGIIGSLVVLGVATYATEPSVGLTRTVFTALLCTLWLWMAGIIVAQCAGMTGWSPISGLALLAVPLVLIITGGGIALAVLLGTAVCVAIGQGADMMGDLKTGHLVGAFPRKQQLSQLAVTWIGPVVSVGTVLLIWHTMGFGPDHNPNIPAPQAATLRGMIEAVLGGQVPVDKYIVGSLIGGALTLVLGGGFGVLVGLSMYLPMFYVLPYGLGCIGRMATDRLIGQNFAAEIGIPVAAGCLIGDSLAGVVYALVRLIDSLSAAGG